MQKQHMFYFNALLCPNRTSSLLYCLYTKVIIINIIMLTCDINHEDKLPTTVDWSNFTIHIAEFYGKGKDHSIFTNTLCSE